MNQSRDRSHLRLLKSEPTAEELYAWVFECLADQHATLEHQAFHLYEDMLARDINPADLHVNGALLQLDLAELALVQDDDSPEPDVVYLDPAREREKMRVAEALLGDGCDHDE